jgi:hypothetical protein
MARIVCRWSRLNAVLALSAAVLSAAVATVASGQAGTPARGAATRPAVTAAARQQSVAQQQRAFELFGEGKLAEAKAENDRALQTDPNNEDAIRLRAVLQDRMNAAATTNPAGGAAAAAASKPKALTNSQVSIIRLLEMSDADNLTGSIRRDAREDYWNNVYVKENGADTSPTAHSAFLNPSNFLEVARRFRETRNPKYMEAVTINNDPASLSDYKTTINTFVLQNCATAACHGGNNAGDFRLLTARDNASIYTNFYVMSMYNAKSGGKVIDRDNPERSLFLQYALPRQQASFPHPGDLDLRKLASTQDPRFEQMRQWVLSLAQPRPNYGITYEVGGTPSAALSAPPATAPSPPAHGR